MKSIIIAAPQSGSGKTTITLGLMECLKRRGLKVAPYKVGPDFIDPGYHRLVCGRPSVNLDGWMCPPEFVHETFAYHAAGADIAVIEGVMGLFDGISGVSDQGSTAHIAKITGSSVILVVDARSMARSAAALVKGFADFDPRVRVVGVIFNNVASEGHARILREALETIGTDIMALGFIPRDEMLHIPSRHLGLFTVEDNPLPAEFLDHLAEVIKDHVDLGLFWVAASHHGLEQGLPLPHDQQGQTLAVATSVTGEGLARIAVARDSAFCFIYDDNMRLLQEAGAEIVEFSPLRGRSLPDGIDGIYLPGGYPELFDDALAANEAMKEAIRSAVAAGMPVYAECGGFIYLTRGIVGIGTAASFDGGGESDIPLHELVGIFPVATRMRPRRKALGYREVELVADTIIGAAGAAARGHEFHYSEMDEMPAEVERVYRLRKRGMDLGPEGYRINNCLGSYVHLHFGSCPGLAAAFVASCRDYNNKKTG